MTGEVTVGTSTASTTPEEFRQQIFDATMAWLRGKKDPWKILDWLEEVITAQLLRRESDANFKEDIVQTFKKMRTIQAEQPVEQQLSWTLAKAEKILNDVLVAREQIATAAQAAAKARATQEAMARRAADIVGRQSEKPQPPGATSGAEVPTNDGESIDVPALAVSYDARKDKLNLPEEPDRKIQLGTRSTVLPEKCNPKNLPDFARRAIVYRISQALELLQRFNISGYSRGMPIPFPLAPWFMERLIPVINELIFPAMYVGNTKTGTLEKRWGEAIFNKRKNWSDVNTETFWDVLSEDDVRNLAWRWAEAWTRVSARHEWKIKGTYTSSESRQNLCMMLGIQDVLDSSTTVTAIGPDGYFLPNLWERDLNFLRSLILMSSTHVAQLEHKLSTILGFYQQEFDRKVNQSEASPGVTKNELAGMARWEKRRENPIPKHMIELLSLMIYFACPKFPEGDLAWIMKIGGYNVSENGGVQVWYIQEILNFIGFVGEQSLEK